MFKKDNFYEIEKRIKDEFKLEKSKQVVDMLNIPYQTYNSRKRRGDFSEEWIIFMYINHGLEIEWLLTGTGVKFKKRGLPEENVKRRKGEEAGVKCNFLKIIDSWISEIKKEEPEAEAWFIYEFKKLFPDFKKWLQRKNETEGTGEEKEELLGGKMYESVD